MRENIIESNVCALEFWQHLLITLKRETCESKYYGNSVHFAIAY